MSAGVLMMPYPAMTEKSVMYSISASTPLSAAAPSVPFTVTIYDADVRRQNFGQVNNAYVRIVDDATGKELVRYDLEEDFSIETALVVGEIYRKGGEWRFNAIGSGYQGGLEALCRSYGVNV